MRVPAVIGSWPEPFLQHSAGEERLPVRVECAGEREPCRLRPNDSRTRASRSARFGSVATLAATRFVLVGPWDAIRRDPGAAQVEDGPRRVAYLPTSPHPARASSACRAQRARRARVPPGPGAGLVAAVRDGERPPTWLVSGVDDAGVRTAAAALDEAVLRDRYAVAVAAGSDESLPLPVVEDS